MAQEAAAVNSTSSSCSIIQVNKDVSFVMDTRDIEYPVSVPVDKNIELSRKTYSKKFPITFNPCVSFAEDLISTESNTQKNKKTFLKSSPKCTSNNIKGILKKRPAGSEFVNVNPIPKKVRKNVSSTKVQSSKVNGRENKLIKFPKSPPKVVDLSSDNNGEILETYSEQTSSKPELVKKISANKGVEKVNDVTKKKNSAKSPSSVLKHCFPSNGDVPITEADTAPVIPSNSVIPSSSVGESSHDIVNESSMKWLSANGTIEFPSRNGEACGAKGPELKYDDKYNLYLPEMKVPQGKKRESQELKSLYANLNEISWAHEKSFQKMLLHSVDDEHRHSARITAKLTDLQKNLRRIKAGSINKLASDTKNTALAKKRSDKLVQEAKYGKPKPKLLVKSVPKKVSLNRVNKKNVSKPVKPNKKQPNVKSIIKYKINPNVKSASIKKKPLVSVNKTSKTVNSTLKKAGSSSQLVKKSLPAIGKNVLQNHSAKSMCEKGSSSQNLIKKIGEIKIANEFEFLKNCLPEDAFAAYQGGPKLRVTVQPLEFTKLWNAEFYEAFKKHVIEQAFRQTFEKKDQESISAMFQELQESCFNPPNNLKTQKKKRPEEEVLRCSVRQSEGAFRYKEIVVKKHDSYMQFVLVPNAMKQNSLTIEAMKELKEAFLLAKKDPNCRAVLLNSSGTYFCTGIDLSLLIGANKKQVAEEMATIIKDLVLTLSTFTKPVIAAVNGTAVGFGVSLLTYCDIVLASDKATFCVPATRLGYLPEGAITLTLPQVVGSGVATEMLLYGRRLTAEQALRHGLVSEVLWPTQLMNEVVPRMQTIVSQPLQVMEATKSMVRCHLWDKLKAHIEREWRLLPTLWLESQCQHNIKRTLQTGWLVD